MSINIKSLLRGSSILLIGGGFAFFVTKRLASQSPQSFTQEIYESSTNLPTKHLYYVVRSDGSTASGSLDPGSSQSRQLRLVPPRQKVTVSDRQKTKSTLHYPADQPVAIPQVTDRCGLSMQNVGTFVGTEDIGGFTTFRYTSIFKQSDTESVTTNYWLAPRLDCSVLNTVAEKKDGTGVVQNRFERKTVNLTFGEPELALFQVPSDYAEVSPSEQQRSMVLDNVRSREGVTAADSHIVPPNVQATWDRLDKLYKEHQQYKH